MPAKKQSVISAFHRARERGFLKGSPRTQHLNLSVGSAFTLIEMLVRSSLSLLSLRFRVFALATCRHSAKKDEPSLHPASMVGNGVCRPVGKPLELFLG
jgi:hypothetical protein